MKTEDRSPSIGKRVTGLGQSLVVIGFALVVVAIVCFLLVINYRFSVDLQETNLSNFKSESEKQAAALGYFFADRMVDLDNLSRSREVDVYFENKALGMSMEYGLNLSLPPIRGKFQDLMEGRKLGKDAVYSRVVLLQSDGTVLVHAAADGEEKRLSSNEWKKELMTRRHREGVILSFEEGKEIVVSVPYFFKGKPAARIAAWLRPQTIYRNILGAEASSKDFSYLIVEKKKFSHAMGLPSFAQISGLPDLTAVSSGKPFEFQEQDHERENWVGLKIPVGRSPFHMVRIVAASNIMGRLTPGQFSTTVGFVVLVLLGGASLLFFLNVKTRSLQIRLDKSIREGEERYRTLFDNAGDTIFIMKDDRFIDCNMSALEMFGCSREQVIGSCPWKFSPPAQSDGRDSKEKALEKIRLALSGEPQSFYWQHCRKDGALFDADVSLTSVRMGNDILVQAFVRDITERKKAEEEKKRLEAQLIQAQKLEAIGTLAGGIAHDFNNLLMGIQGHISLMLMDSNTGHPYYLKLKNIEDQISTGANLTRQLLGFARGGKYDLRPIDMNDVLLRSSAMFGRTKKEIVIHRALEKELWAVEGDATQMEQVLMNLYVNAWQAMPGGGRLYLETSNLIHTTADEEAYYIMPGRYVRISVTDTGVGMDEKTKERIFEPFFTTREMGRGTGLGLAMVYGIVKGHNGYINVNSRRGRGTTFNIYLPAVDKSVMKEEEAFFRKILRGRETILLVDDEEVILETMEQVLEALGYRILTARSGSDALKIYDENKNAIDLILLDMIMPHMGGGETYDRLKEISPGIKVILSSGYSLDGEASRIMARGCQGFIQKPVNIDRLSQKIREVLDQKM